MSLLVSVVVPVHNASAHLERCAGSLLAQTWGSLEIIMVDDGSSDDSLQIIRALARSDDRVIVLEQSNAGAAAARNRGLAVASGEYVGFLDVDDWAEPDMIEQLVACAESQLADVVLAGCWVDVVDDQERELSSRELLPTSCDTLGSGTPPAITPELTTLIGFAWNKLYRREFLEERGAIFPEGQPIFEDLRFNAEVLTASSRVGVLDRALVHYVHRAEGTGGTRFVQEFLELRLRALADLRRVYASWGVSSRELDRADARWRMDALRSVVRRTCQHERWSFREKCAHLREVRALSGGEVSRSHREGLGAGWPERAYARAFFSLPPTLVLTAECLYRASRRLSRTRMMRKAR